MMNITRYSMQSRLLWVALMVFFPVGARASVAGHVQFVAGDVRIVDAAGHQRTAQKGQEVSEGETVLTAANGSAQLRMIDGGVLALRPDTQLKVDAYAFDGTEDGSENALLSLAKGGLRAITGLIGRHNKEKLMLRTPSATIGVRGTDHEPVVLLASPPTGSGTGNPEGTYDKVNVGAINLTTQAGTAVVGANQVGYAASPGHTPVILPKMPDFYRVTPTPLAKQDQKQQQQGQGSTQQSATVASNADNTHSDSKTDATIAVATATSVMPIAALTSAVNSTAPITPPATLTATDASGDALNLTQQSVTTASGQTQALTSATVSTLGTAGKLLLVGFPNPGAGGGAFPQFFSIGGSGLSLTSDSSGNLTAANINGNSTGGDSSGGINAGAPGFQMSLTQTGSTLTDSSSDAAIGLAWGRWQGGQISIGGSQPQSITLGSGSLDWLTASNATPPYLAQVLTGSANYTLVGGTRPADQNGNVGTLNSASLGVNFSTQVVNSSLNFTVAGNNWIMQSGAMPLQGPQFSTYSNCSGTTQCINNVTLTLNGAAVPNAPNQITSNVGYAVGNISGFLTGVGLNGAALEYSVQQTVPTPATGGVSGQSTSFTNDVIQGVAAFSGPMQNVSTPFRAVGISDGWGELSASSSGSGVSSSVAPYYFGSINGAEQPVASVVDSAAGLTSFVGQAAGYSPANASITVPGPNENGPLDTIKIGTAANTDLGSATIGGTTVSWGRWAGGTVNIYSLDGSTLLGSIDNSNRSIHWVTTSALTSTFLNLPLTGTVTYTVAGNTAPTDFKGNVGTLGSATLAANFGNATLNTSINVSFNAATNTSAWNLTANNVPLSGGDGFNSSSALNGVNGITNTVTCTGGSCGSAANGYVQGHFFAGAQGAIMIYGMTTGNTTSTSSSGTSASSFTPLNQVTGLIVMKH